MRGGKNPSRGTFGGGRPPRCQPQANAPSAVLCAFSLPSSIACDAGRHSFRSSSRRERSRPVHLHGHCRCSRQ